MIATVVMTLDTIVGTALELVEDDKLFAVVSVDDSITTRNKYVSLQLHSQI